MIDGNSKLGTFVASSRHVKEDVRDMADASQGLLQLRPVTFRYRPSHDDGTRALQYGLLAEEVAEVYPELVTRDPHGDPIAVRYHVLPPLLLNELQRQARQLQAQAEAIEALRRLVVEQAAALATSRPSPAL